MLHVQADCDHFQTLVHVLQARVRKQKFILTRVHLGFRQCILMPEDSQNMAETCIIHY